MREWFWESFRVGQDLEHNEIDDWSFYAKALLKCAKMKLRVRISKFSSFIHYLVGLLILKTKIECITAILLVTDFYFWHKNLKISALMGRNI
jgi:hypothetical protein